MNVVTRSYHLTCSLLSRSTTRFLMSTSPAQWSSLWSLLPCLALSIFSSYHSMYSRFPSSSSSSLLLCISPFISLIDSLTYSCLFFTNSAIFLSLLFPLRGTVVLVLLVFCICFLIACIMYLHITRVQVNTAAFLCLLYLSAANHTKNDNFNSNYKCILVVDYNFIVVVWTPLST